MPPSTIAAEDSGGSEHVRVVYKESTRARHPSAGSGRSHPSSRGSQRIESYSSSGTASSYDVIDEDEIEPSDSASRARAHTGPRYIDERPAPPRRHSSHRRERAPAPEVDERRPRRHSSRRHHSSRPRRHDSQRPPSDESYSDTVASHHDDYPDSRYGSRAYPPPPSFRHGHGGYPPSIPPSAPGYPPGYGSRQALMQIPQQHDEFGYPVNDNPFIPQDPRANPFTPMSNASGPGYFGMDPHGPPMHAPRPPHPPRPQSYAGHSHYGSEAMSPYGHPGMPPYHGYGMAPLPGYPPMHGWYPPPSTHSSPPPPETKEEGKSKEIEAISALLQKTEEARLAWQKEMVAKAAEDAAAQAEKLAKEEAEKRKKEEIATASKSAKEAAEKKAEADLKKARDEHEKKLKEAEKAREDAEKKQKELEAEAERLKPPDHAGKSIKFKDVLDRKFSFPFHLCKTWKGMETLIKQAFMQIDDVGDHVRQGHYDLIGPDGEIILPQVWENMVQPDWEIEMCMWPLPEEEKKKKNKHAASNPMTDPMDFLGLGPPGGMGFEDPGKKKSTTKKDGTKKKTSKSADSHVVNVGPSNMPPPPPPPGYNPGMLPDPFDMSSIFPDMQAPKDNKPKKSNSKSSKGNNASGLAAWFAGSSGPRPSKKDDEKLDLVRHKSGHNSVSGGSNASIKHKRRDSHHSGRSHHSSSHSQRGNAERVVACAVM